MRTHKRFPMLIGARKSASYILLLAQAASAQTWQIGWRSPLCPLAPL
jgi:hypothetical protein